MKDRIGVDINQKLALEPAVGWAVEHKVPYIDLCLDQTPELLQKDSPRLRKARARLEKAEIRLGLHTLSAVNIAETSPFVAEAADEYLESYIDAAKRLGYAPNQAARALAQGTTRSVGFMMDLERETAASSDQAA